jgi:lipoprotein signal peptidase
MMTSTAEPRACRSGRAITIFLLIATIGLAADLVSKHLTFSRLIGNAEDLPHNVQSTRESLNELLGREPDGKEVLHGLDLHRDVGAGIQLTLSTNPGVVFGILLPRAAVMAATVFISAFVIFLFATSPVGHRLTQIATALILAGALGNAYDRLFSVITLDAGIEPIRNQVRDFLDFSNWGYPWIFNVADVLLVVGVGLMVLQSLRHRPPAKAEDGGK